MNKQINYKSIKQKPYCCVPATISIILDRRKIKHGTQDEIGYDLGLVVPQDVAHLFKKARVGNKPSAGYGTQVNKKHKIGEVYNSITKEPISRAIVRIYEANTKKLVKTAVWKLPTNHSIDIINRNIRSNYVHYI